MSTVSFPAFDFPEFSNIRGVVIEPGFGHIGIDITLDDQTLPCKNPLDPDRGACQIEGSYAYYYEFGNGRIYCGPVPVDPTDSSGGWQQFGIFITNSLRSSACFGHDRPDIIHNWGKRIVKADVEIYPWISSAQRRYDPVHNVYGGARFSVNDWSFSANNGRYSPEIGTIVLPSRNGAYALLNGFVWEDRAAGRPAGPSRLSVDMFQQGSEPHTDYGYKIEGFASTGIASDNHDGYYTSGPLYPGRYLLYVTDTQNGLGMTPFHADIVRSYERIDFEVSPDRPPRQISTLAPGFGLRFPTLSNSANTVGGQRVQGSDRHQHVVPSAHPGGRAIPPIAGW